MQESELRDLSERVKEDAEFIHSTQEGIRQASFKRILTEFDSINNSYLEGFVRACKDGHVNVKLRGRLLNREAGCVLAYLETKLNRSTPNITYHCSYCDENLDES